MTDRAQRQEQVRVDLHLHIEGLPLLIAAFRDSIVARIESLHTLIEKVKTMSEATQTAIDALIADNAQLQSDVAAAPASIAALVATAIAGQVASGVTPAQMTQLTDLHTALGGATTQLEAALAGTPPVITPPASF